MEDLVEGPCYVAEEGDLDAPVDGGAAASLFRYAVARRQDGTVDLTVWEDGRACAVELSREEAARLGVLLIDRGGPTPKE